MYRRRFLRFLGALAAAHLLSYPWSWTQRRDVNSVAGLARKLTEPLRHRESARRLGLGYLEMLPDDADEARLVDLICSSDRNVRARFAAASPRVVRGMIATRQAEDFRQGRTLVVDGWILSRTELRLCALAAVKTA